jgi:uncharacterized membrane-anchored protein
LVRHSPAAYAIAKSFLVLFFKKEHSFFPWGSFMQVRNVPVLGLRYWTAICLASVFGANLGDFVSHDLHLGHVRGVPVLAVLFAGILIGERRAVWGGEAWYWAAIVLLRTAATNLADFATHDLHMAYAWVIAALEAVLVLLVVPGGGAARAAAAGRPVTDGWYWGAMLTAGTLGTAIGDCTADDFGLGSGVGSLVLCGVLAAIFAVTQRGAWVGKAAYWITVVGVRSAGTTVGDFFAFRHGMGLGLPVSTLVSGMAMVGVLVLWRPQRVREAVGAQT